MKVRARKDSLFGDLNVYVPEGVKLYTHDGTNKVDLGFPSTRLQRKHSIVGASPIDGAQGHP